jgi:hypothetical protein
MVANQSATRCRSVHAASAGPNSDSLVPDNAPQPAIIVRIIAATCAFSEEVAPTERSRDPHIGRLDLAITHSACLRHDAPQARSRQLNRPSRPHSPQTPPRPRRRPPSSRATRIDPPEPAPPAIELWLNHSDSYPLVRRAMHPNKDGFGLREPSCERCLLRWSSKARPSTKSKLCGRSGTSSLTGPSGVARTTRADLPNRCEARPRSPASPL